MTFSFQDTSSKLISIEVPPHSHRIINVPIKPLIEGRLLIRARPNDDSERFLSTTTQVLQEGYKIVKSSVMAVDLTNGPYFMGDVKMPLSYGLRSRHLLTLTEGIVGPIVPRFPSNISTILDLPKVGWY